MSVKVIGKPAEHVESTIAPSTYRRIGSQLYKWDESKHCYVWVFTAKSSNVLVLKSVYEANCDVL